MQNLDLAAVWHWAMSYLPVFIGAAGGFLFYRFVGCKTGACPITSNPWISTIYGAIIGAMYLVR